MEHNGAVTEPAYEPMEHDEKLQWMLETHGWGMEPVAPSHGEHLRAAYSYTFGLEALLGHPELVIFGLAPVAARGLLDLIVNQLRLGGSLPTGQLFDGLLDNGLVSALLDVEVAEFGDYFPTLPLIYGDQPWRVRQFVWPDRSGTFPWDDNWPENLRYAQPIIGDW